MAGKVVHFEIPIDDGERAVAFYQEAFGWSLERWGPMEYWTTDAGEGDGIGGALTRRDDESSSLIFYISVEDVDQALAAVEAAGGRRLTERMPIPTVGWSAFFEDSEGNKVGVFQEDPAAPMPGGNEPEVGFEVVTIEPQQTAVVRDEVPVDQLPSLFDRAFHLVMEEVRAQGLDVTGPPFGFYPRMPGETVEVAAGFPVSGPVAATGEVTALELPGGRAVTGIHVGSYDGLEQTYQELVAWVQAQGLEGGIQMWESYLTDPGAEPDPAKWRTRITWPLRG